MRRKRNIPEAEIIKAEIPLVEKIIRDETWYEGERRRCAVDPRDVVVRKRVTEVILQCGDKIWAEASRMVKENTHGSHDKDDQSNAA